MLNRLRTYLRNSERIIPAHLRRLKRRFQPIDSLFGREFLSDIIPPRTVGIEIGVYRGEFTRFLLDYVSPRKLYLIDPWFPTHRGVATYDAPIARMDRRHTNVLRRFRSERKNNQVRVLRLYSQEAACLFDDNAIDWVYVDGDHREEAVRADITRYWPKLKHGGLMIFDDYEYDEGWDDGVTKACDALLPTLNATRVEKNHQLVVRKEAES